MSDELFFKIMIWVMAFLFVFSVCMSVFGHFRGAVIAVLIVVVYVILHDPQ